jgi:RHS repeat-associated protein
VTAGAPLSYTYYDQFGRVVYAMTRNYADTDFVRVTTSFDERGNTISESAPHDPTLGESASKGTRFLGYDALNRLTSKEIDQTQGQVMQTTYTHTGLTTNINAEGILMSRTYDGFGRLVETVDGKGGYTRYAYDGAGNPIVISDPVMIPNPSVAPTVGIRAAYNALGHKLWVEDPNWFDEATQTHLTKSFSYNAVGEVLSELDPNGNLVEMVYDSLGRMTERFVNGELNGMWHYDSADTYGGLGLLWLEDSQFRSDGSRLQKFYYYSDGSSGRKDLLQVKHRFYENADQYDFEEYDTAYFTDGFYARPKGVRYPGGANLAFDFNNHGHVTQEKDPVNGTVYRNISDRDSRGQIKAASIANHTGSFRYQVTQDYFPETGQVDYISLSNGSTSLQNLTHQYDEFGNLKWRSTTVGGGATETLYYDELQRLTTATRSYMSGGGDTVNYFFDASGTFDSKSDYDAAPAIDVSASYVKHASRPHVVTQLTLSSGGSVAYGHDGNGNLTQGDGETIDYNAFNKPVRIDAIGSNAFADFSYGADLRRYRQMRSDGTRIYYLDKLMEIEAVGTSVDYRHYLGEVAVLTKTGSLNDPSPGIKYLFRDRLGSVAAIGNSSGSMVEFRAYDPYGRPRNGNWTDKAPEPILASSVTDRGFTDHEHLDDWQLIHMNGRGFDYNSGRFLSLDPFIQEPGNSQSINGFAYIMNNPLSGTDPSGYFSMMVKVSYRNKSTSAYFGGTPVRHSNQRENNQVNNGATNDQQAQHVDLRGKVSRDLH